jgi:hypothetical protein
MWGYLGATGERFFEGSCADGSRVTPDEHSPETYDPEFQETDIGESVIVSIKFNNRF